MCKPESARDDPCNPWLPGNLEPCFFKPHVPLKPKQRLIVGTGRVSQTCSCYL